MNTIRRSVLVVSCALALGTTTPAHADIFEDILGGVNKVSKWVTDIGNSIDNWFSRVFRELGDIADDAEATAKAIANMVEEQAASAEPFVNNAAAFAELRFRDIEATVTSVVIGMDEFNDGQTIEKCVGPCAEFKTQMIELLGISRAVQDLSLDFIDVTPIDFPSFDLDLDVEIIELAPAFVLYPVYVSMQAGFGGNINGALDAAFASFDDLEDLMDIARGRLPSGSVSLAKAQNTAPERSLAYLTNSAPSNEAPICTKLLADGDVLTVGQDYIYSAQTISIVLRAAGLKYLVDGETSISETAGNKVIENNKTKKIGIGLKAVGDVIAEIANTVNHRFQNCRVIRATLRVNDKVVAAQADLSEDISSIEEKGDTSKELIDKLLASLGDAQVEIDRANRRSNRNKQMLDEALAALVAMQKQQDETSKQTEQILRLLSKQQYVSSEVISEQPSNMDSVP